MNKVSSESWRIKTSSILEIELAQSLTALRKCIGSISPNTELVSFGGSSANSKGERIQIDTEFATKAGIFPIPSENFDILVGLAVHEAAHTAVKSDRLLTPLYDHTQTIFSERSFQEIAEEIYTDSYVERHFPVQHAYLRKARDGYDKPVITDWSKPAIVWTSVAVYGHSLDHKQIPRWQHAIHTLLGALADDLRQDKLVELRQRLYQDYWKVIQDLLRVEQTKANLGKVTIPPVQLPPELAKDWSADSQDLDLSPPANPDDPVSEDGTGKPTPTEQVQDSDTDGEPDSGTGESKDGDEIENESESKATPSTRPFPSEAHGSDMVSLPQQIQDAVDKALESATEDLTSEITQALIESKVKVGQRMAAVYSNSLSKTPAPEPSPKLVLDLEWVSRIKNTIRTLTIRGEPEGILDRRRLYRHYTDNRPYKIHRTTPRQELDLVLLVDGSSSMSGKPEFIYETCYALLKVIPEAHMLVYNAPDSHSCSVVNYNNGKQIRKVEPEGSTPTGRAMIMAAIKYPRSLMIHFSDGESNQDIDPVQAMEIVIAKKWPKIQVVNIILDKKGDLEENWPAKGPNYTTEFIKELKDFPGALRRALKPWYQV